MDRLLIINQVTTFFLFLVFLLSSFVYNYLRTQAPSSSSRSLYKRLVIGWLALSFSPLFGLIRGFRPATYELYHIWGLKLSLFSGMIGIIWIFMFVGKLYESEWIRKTLYIVGWGIGLTPIILGIIASDRAFEIVPSDSGVEIILPDVLGLTSLVSFLSMIIVFGITLLYFNFQMIPSKLKKKITRVSLAYIVFWFSQILESGGILISHFMGFGMLLTRILIMISAFMTIIAWAGKKKFFEAFKNFFRYEGSNT